MRWGYARVSTLEQNAEAQVSQLVDAGVPERRVIVEHASGSTKRPMLSALVAERLRRGDELVVVRLDRVGRNARDMYELLEVFRAEGITLRSLREGLDSSGPLGQFLAHVMIAVGQWERETIRDRTREGIARARARGVHLGRPPKLSPIEERTALAWRQKGWSIAEIAKSLHCSTATVERVLRRQKQKHG